MNFDFRQYLAEGYDAEEKNSVIVYFAKYLETALGLTFDPETQQYSKGLLWFTISNGNGEYNDKRIIVGTSNSGLKKDEEWTTLNFMVSDMGELVAYLDAEDHGLLYNTPAFKKDAAGKKTMMKWNLGVSYEQIKAAFDAATEYIDEYFADADIRKGIADTAKAEYDPLDKFRLMKALKSREAADTTFAWTKDDEAQLNNYRAELARVNKNIEYYTNAKAAAKATGETGTAQDCDYKIADLTKRKVNLKQDIKDMEADKLKYQKLFNVKGERESAESREMKIQALGLDRATAVGLSDEELSDMMKKTFKKDGTRRKQRAVKTGDVKDAKEVEKKAKSKSLRDELAAELAALKSKK